VFSNLGEGERLLSQLILTPAPRSWGDRFASYARPMSPSTGEPLSVQVAFRQGISVFMILAWVFLVLCALFSFFQSHWLEFLFFGVLAALAGLAAFCLFSLALDRANLDPELVQKKIGAAAYDVSLRLAAFAPTPERAKELVWELAALWHLPLDHDVPLVERTQAKRLLPLPQTVREGILIGQSEHAGHRYPVHMSLEALWGHVFMVAKTQAGKSTLMGHLATAVMRQAERRI
jgi:hypothetical protein